MSVVLAVEEVGPCRMQIKIEIPAPAFEAETARVTADYGRKARIPGFRKGKVPANLVRKHFGKEIEQEVVERLVPRYWRQAAAEKGIEPLTAPEVSLDPFLTGAPMTFTATVDVRPEIELRNYQDFNLPAPATEPTADEVQRTLDDVRRAHAQWIPVERAAATGDRAKIQITETTAVDPATADEVAVQEMEIEVGTPQIWEELSLAVTGLTVGQGSKFRRSESVTPEASEESALVGPDGERIGNLDKKTVERTFDVKLVELSEAKLPALDDEFARHLGKFENIGEVEADVRRRIETAKRDDALRQRETAMLDQLTDRHPFPLPEGVILQETEELLREYAESLVRRGVDLENAGLDWQKLGEQARPQAERRVKARLLLDAVSEKEGIEVGEEEFEQALAVLARTQGMAAQALRQKLDQGGQLAGLRARMRREKTVRRLLGEPDRATVAPQAATDAAPAAQAAGETAPDA